MDPVRDRPGGVYWSPDRAPPLDWTWAAERLESARAYWIGSTRPDGRPHVRPVWGVWLDDKVWFESYSIARNIEADARVSIHLDPSDEVVVLEGEAVRETGAAAIRRFLDAYNPKYSWSWEPKNVGFLFTVAPAVAFGWRCDNSGADGGSLFEESGTRWRFDGAGR